MQLLYRGTCNCPDQAMMIITTIDLILRALLLFGAVLLSLSFRNPRDKTWSLQAAAAAAQEDVLGMFVNK